ncbi:hypothetical protein RvY_18248 [Ramazzottius varieornatus]|uniref:Uncharacterized protein n=1 Tax=Ramazzottius varieornatus TaxID=947166 RepID=A0A1D1W519_RAMVA|nr:hypothetical protein RvY_18248 [Ramazzottius varieornatus]
MAVNKAISPTRCTPRLFETLPNFLLKVHHFGRAHCQSLYRLFKISTLDTLEKTDGETTDHHILPEPEWYCVPPSLIKEKMSTPE